MIYALENLVTTNVRIGFSDNHPSRIRAHRYGTDCSLRFIGTIPGDRGVESALHRRFRARRVPCLSRSWFYSDPEFLREVEQIFFAKPKLWGHEVRSVYLAGKVTGDPWRDGIFGSDLYCVQDSKERWNRESAIAIPNDSRRLDYAGPFWMDLWGGHNVNPGPHAFSEDYGEHFGVMRFTTNADDVRNKCLGGVARSDLVFAWINDKECFGTLAEITLAYCHRFHLKSKNPLVVIATPFGFSALKEMWFTIGMADHIFEAESAKEAWRQLWDHWSHTPPTPLGHTISRFVESDDFDEDQEDDCICDCCDPNLMFGPDADEDEESE